MPHMKYIIHVCMYVCVCWWKSRYLLHSPSLWDVSSGPGRDRGTLQCTGVPSLHDQGKVEDCKMGLPSHICTTWCRVLGVVSARHFGVSLYVHVCWLKFKLHLKVLHIYMYMYTYCQHVCMTMHPQIGIVWFQCSQAVEGSGQCNIWSDVHVPQFY